MTAQLRWPLTEKLRAGLIAKLTENLQLLRVKIGISQEELAKIIGLSRQTYSYFETGRRTMSWQAYLSLVLFFDVNPATHGLLHHLGCFPDILVDREAKPETGGGGAEAAAENADIIEMLSKIDAQALRSVRTMLMLEYARCANIPGEAVVKAFGGAGGAASGDYNLQSAVNRIRNASGADDGG